ncbi:CPBP family intramembrane metalloprotease [Arthrobacter sp. zg-ZUI100]|uniref:CPBP family intramembrane glutamic endopeptidase n=1 Tax=Arthrobacter jiangjiafuii TaxID=2817475 RepID=UPI001AED32B0|nr:CPBP family intramembrane glutamic endopeptidase [Arthrobacter jiangjiafuii]MBP3035226.1 CPBP family intramembrane metalloprotease [Arthrobacter jiangjiafuii]
MNRAAIAPLPYTFSRRDGFAAGFYVVFVLIFSYAPGLGIPGLTRLIPDPLLAGYVVNLVFYLCAGALAVWASWRFAVRETRILATRPWLTLAIIPGGVFAMLLLTAVAVLVSGPPETAVNQEAVQGLVVSLPPLLIIPLLVVIAPFVEEYIFRHLLIGKLSRYLNIWACCAISVVLFAGIHVAGKEALALPVLMPYLAMGAVLVGIYVWAGKNFILSYAVHAAKNLLAVLLTYAIPAELLG